MLSTQVHCVHEWNFHQYDDYGEEVANVKSKYEGYKGLANLNEYCV